MRRIGAAQPLPNWIIALWAVGLGTAFMSAFLLTLDGVGRAALIAPVVGVLQTTLVLASRRAQRKKHGDL